MNQTSLPHRWALRTSLALMTSLAASAHAADAVCLYEHVDYGGASTCLSADNAWVGNDWNDRVSSVKVSPGYQVQLFADINYGGGSLTLQADTPNLDKLGFNDLASSLRVSTTGCNAVTWTAGVNYPLGTVVYYAPAGGYYKVYEVAGNGSDATIPTISTWYWQPTSCGGGNGGTGAIVGGYYPNWTPSPPRIRDLNPNYNLVYLFAAHPVGGPPGTTGAVTFDAPGDGRGAATNLKADLQYARSTQGRKIILSVGGAGQGMSFPNRGKSQAFVDSIVGIYNQLGGFDGLDWNTFEGSQAPDTSEMIWISLQLKARFPGFIVTAPPAPWNPVDKAFCQAMLQAGALDYAAPQYYDGPNLADPGYVVPNVNEWVALLGASHVVVGFGVNNAPNYMNQAQAISTWNQVKANNPSLRGAFDWQIGTDESQGWPFANGVAPLVLH